MRLARCSSLASERQCVKVAGHTSPHLYEDDDGLTDEIAQLRADLARVTAERDEARRNYAETVAAAFMGQPGSGVRAKWDKVQAGIDRLTADRDADRAEAAELRAALSEVARARLRRVRARLDRASSRPPPESDRCSRPPVTARTSAEALASRAGTPRGAGSHRRRSGSASPADRLSNRARGHGTGVGCRPRCNRARRRRGCGRPCA